LKSRAYYQFGSLTLKKRAKSADVWEFRYYEDAATGGRARKALFIGTTDMYKTEALARKAVEAIFLKLNAEKPMHHLGTVTFGGLCDRYISEELPERYSTRKSYLSNINQHIKPRWGEYLIGAIRPMAVEGWFKEMDKSPKTKAHIRSVVHVIFECAARWELFNERRNPIEMVRVKDSTKRRKRPMILTNESFDAVLAGLPEPFRTMVVVAQCLGLRVSEITGLQWGDLDTERRQLLVQRSIVNGRVDDVKTEYSHDYVPIMNPCWRSCSAGVSSARGRKRDGCSRIRCRASPTTQLRYKSGISSLRASSWDWGRSAGTPSVTRTGHGLMRRVRR
jgi:integrase